jgi:2-methylaconitate cis-trans-isomerase PrpF
MRSSLFSKIIFASLALLLAGSAFAANAAHKQSFELSAPTQVNGTLLPAGEYQAQWEGSGPSVQVSITQGKKVIATVPAQVVQLAQASSENQAEIKNASSSDRQLTSLQFSGKKYALDLGSESARAQSKSDSSN